MLRDRGAFATELNSIEEDFKAGRCNRRIILGRLTSLENRVRASVRERERREKTRPRCSFPGELPITSKKDQIVQAISTHQVVIVAGDTGSGKSTQIPKMCLEAGRGVLGKIGCTQPRRIAATTISQRIAQELGQKVGRFVGYKIRFSDRTSRDACIKVMTDGMLLAEIQGDPDLYEYDTLIIDEAHERSLNIDLLLGVLKTFLPKRPELRLVISSATLDLKKFSEAFDNPPIIEVSGRRYPVKITYMPLDPALEERGEATYVDMAVEAVDRLQEKGAKGDILVFMPTERDILETCGRLEGRHYPGTAVLPLFARLSSGDQGRVFSHRGRKIVVATNVAETSLTIPGIKYVIDTGLARIVRYLPSTRISSLPVSSISKSSADQRAGRCGRVSDGVCIRLYFQEEYDSRPAFTEPEILRSNLAEVILRMIHLNLGDISSFPFLDKPSPRRIKDGFDLLSELGAVRKEGDRVLLTDTGRLMARMPMDPKISRMILEARKEDCIREVAIIASALSIQDPRERPLEKSVEADRAHAPFKHPDSDFITLLNIWNKYQNTLKRLKTQAMMRKFCKEHFLSFARMREWAYVFEQIMSILREQRIPLGRAGKREVTESLYGAIHRSILSGLLSNIAMKKEKNLYLAARGREVMIYPGSALFNRKGGASWIVAAEIIKTSRLFARTASRIDSKWLEGLAGDLCRRSYTNPRWDESRGEVVADELVTLYGLPIVRNRAVSYGAIDPQKAHEIFIHSALVEGRVRERPPFLRHNEKLIEKIRAMEERLRRRDILIDDKTLADYYSKRLKGVRDIPSLKRMIKERGGDDFLKLKEEELMLAEPDREELSAYPDHLAIEGDRLEVSYKFAPGTEADGATVWIPFPLKSKVPPERLERGIPGLYQEKILALVKGLPKRYRRYLVPVPRTVEIILEEMEVGDRPLFSALSQFIYERFGVDIPAKVWLGVDIPDHLKLRVSITDGKGRELESGRDIWHLLNRGKTEVTRYFEDSNGREGARALFSISSSKDLKFLRRSLELPDGTCGASMYLGGKAAVEKAIYEGIVREFLCKDIKTRSEFRAHVERVRRNMLSRARELKSQTVRILGAYEETRRTIEDIEKANRSNSAVLELCARIRGELEELVPINFPERFTPERLTHIPRYLKALKIRAERGSNDPGKDRRKEAQMEVFEQALCTLAKEMEHYASPAKREAVEEFRWMLEEFRVSLFAQELKTLYPVSQKRLEARLKEIERMI
ncbi:MAG: ATP-dependent RNA helicase HrpA [Deltaproteobacteria bacterium]|nr:ATP-dependent RNA helicase HrpA [Deltaproteobacteria bacterium]